MNTKTLYGLLALLVLAACQGAAGPAAIAGPADVPRITPQELKAQLDAGEAVIVADARSLEAFEMRHIAGAISVPLFEIADHLDELPHRAHVVFYCT